MIKVNTLENYNQIRDKYYVTTCGKIIIIEKNKYKIMKPNINKKGYHQYRLRIKENNIDSIRPYIHKLVALAYIKNNNIDNTQVDHIDMDKSHNYIGNLEWVTNLENMKRRNDKCGYANSNLKNEDILYIRKTYKLWREGKIWKSNTKILAKQFNVSEKTITNIVNKLSFKNIK